jgi:hypothetical protein
LISTTGKDVKFLVLPTELVRRLNELALRQGVSVSTYAVNALEQALRGESLGASLEEAVDTHMLLSVQLGAGAVQIPRSSLDALIRDISLEHREELKGSWFDMGRWYGAYLQAKLGNGDCLDFLEKALLVSWNLDEVEVRANEVEAELRFASFVMSLELTELLVSYISGVMSALGYQVLDNEFLRGLATLHYRKKLGVPVY